MSRKKKNPSIHLKQSDVNKLKNDATSIGIRYAMVIFLYVMREKEGYGDKRLKRVYDEMNDVVDSINKGYINLNDLEQVLSLEYDLTIEFQKKNNNFAENGKIIQEGGQNDDTKNNISTFNGDRSLRKLNC